MFRLSLAIISECSLTNCKNLEFIHQKDMTAAHSRYGLLRLPINSGCMVVASSRLLFTDITSDSR